MSASRTRIWASSRRSAGQLAATASGAMTPIATRASRTPSRSTTSGVTRPPTATPSVSIASNAANMRARTVSSVSRAQHREAATSISALPTPTTPSSDDRGGLLGDGADQRQRCAEHRDADAEPRAEPAAPDQPEREHRAEHAAGADGGVEDSDAGLAGVEEVDRDDDGEHGQAARA